MTKDTLRPDVEIFSPLLSIEELEIVHLMGTRVYTTILGNKLPNKAIPVQVGTLEVLRLGEVTFVYKLCDHRIAESTYEKYGLVGMRIMTRNRLFYAKEQAESVIPLIQEEGPQALRQTEYHRRIERADARFGQ